MNHLSYLKIGALFCLCVLPFAFIFAQNSHSKVLLQFARKYYLMGKIEPAAEKAELALETDPQNPAANVLYGLTLLHHHSLENLIRAEKLIEQFAPKLSDRAFGQFALGELYKFRHETDLARKYYRKSVELNPNFIQPYIELGEYHFNQMLEYYNRVSDTRIPLSFREYAVDDYDRAVDYLKKALKIDPQNSRAIYLLGSVYFEMEEFGEMISLFTPYLKKAPDDKDINLFMGLAHLSLNRYSSAAQFFNRAMDNMPEAEKNVFLNPEFLVKKDSLKERTPETVQQFWQKNDPMFLTDENERLLEHYGRVAYANMRFSLPSLGIYGWQTDRGKTYIRYGKPNFIVEYGKSMEAFAVYPPAQIWVYPQFQLMFSDEFWNGNFRFTQPFPGSNSPFKERTNIDFGLVAENVFQEIPQSFDFELPGGTFFSPYQISFFKGKSETDAILSFGLPWEEDLDSDSMNYRTGFFLLGKDKLPKFRLTENLSLDYRKNEALLQNRYLVNGLQFQLPPGTYQYSFEIINRTLEQDFVDRRKVAIPDFSRQELLLSDLLLAYRIEPSQKKGVFTRRGVDILPNVTRTFDKSETLFIYFEVYNLLPDVSGGVRYVVENTITRQRKTNFLKALLGKRKQRTTIVNEYSGTGTSDFVIQSIRLNNLEPGDYELEITVKDEIGFFEASKTSDFVLVESGVE